MIAIVNNLGPPITVFMAFLILKEKVKRFEILMISLTVVGILTVVIGGNDEDEDEDTGQP